MGEIMRGISFEKLVNWVINEYNHQGSVFGIRKEKFYKNEKGTFIEIFGEKISSPVGPAAGPNSQLAQNILASYLAGARFFEVKTVQKMDGEELRNCVPRPCINAEDEGYNVEWSTELTVNEAFEEYVKAWFLIHVFAKELNISENRDFAFNMSVGYDLDGIKTEKVNNYIDGMINAENTKCFKECKQYLLDNLNLFNKLTKQDVLNISSAVAPSITLSTLHGCPSEEIEKIASYFLTEKRIHTFIKCNPTLLGYKFARNLLDEMGYNYISFDSHHFDNDLKFDDAVLMLKRLLDLSKSLNLEFGVKITNTFPVEIKNKELPGEEMYMSGRALYPLSINVAKKLSNAFNGKLQISFSGGADYFNIDKIFETGIQPITVATTILKPGGYERLLQLALKVEPLLKGKFVETNIEKLTNLADNAKNEKFHLKNLREVKSLKTHSKLNLFDCFMAPCKDSGCPINQQIPEYGGLVAQGKFDEAFKVIAIDNALPAITSVICDHQCQNKCTRVDYDKPVQIRTAKNAAVVNAQDNFIKNIVKKPILLDKKVVVIGAGPAGVAVSYFLRRNGLDVTVLEKLDKPMGVVNYIIPSFRISDEMILKDYNMAVGAGVNFHFNVNENYNIEDLKKQYDYIVIATGAWKEGISPIKEGSDKVIDALDFLIDSKKNNCNLELGKKVAIIGAGDVAMDCARAAKKAPGVTEVIIVYRRTREFMPAQFEEIELAMKDGVKIMELLSPVSFDGKTLICEVQELTDNRDKTGRKLMQGTGKEEKLDFDTIIGAVGARVCSKLFKENKITLDKFNIPCLNENLETNIKNVYIAGDCKKGAATIVKAIADAKIISKSILKDSGLSHDFVKVQYPIPEKVLYERKGTLKDIEEKGRCLVCDQICEVCCDVCPNRANVSIVINDPLFKLNHQILHIDGMCNECGNCGIFCPHAGNPYKDKFTLFWTEEDFNDSTNKGFLKLSEIDFKIRNEEGNVVNYKLGDYNISYEMKKVIDTVLRDYNHYFI